jgi:ketosteroid isomerase-like protein
VSTEAVRIVEQIQDALDVEDVVAAFEDAEIDRRVRQTLDELAEPDFDVVMVGPDYLPQAAERTGSVGFRDAWLDWTSPFESFRIHVERVIDAGDRVVSLVRQVGRTKTGGVEIEAPAAAVWTIRDGKLRRVEFHLDQEAALRSAGLGE